MGLPLWLSGKTLPSMKETQFQSLSQEDPLEEEAATHSSILAWEIAQTEEPGGLQSMGSQESDTTERLTHTHVCETESLCCTPETQHYK